VQDSDRFRLLFGPYECPTCSVGDKVLCEFRDREVVVGGMTDAPIQWPYRKGPGPPGPILFGDLIRAVETESEIAVAHHWGVSNKTVWAWRKAMEVPRMTKGGTQLAIAYAPERLNEEARTSARRAMGRADVRARLSEAKVGKPLHPNMIAAQREAVRKPKTEARKKAASERMRRVWEHPEEHGLPATHRWTDEEIAILGKEHDAMIAERLGVAPHIVEQKRRRLGIPGLLDRWSVEEVAVLGTAKDREIAERLGKTTAAVRRKREILGILPHVARWSEAEIALLGTDTDRAVAEKLGRTASAVETKRMSLGIMSSRPKRRT
jgi:hypothetical protein